jgi:hypothetical protein
MKNKAIKNLIILGTILFSFNFTQEAFAMCSGYSCDYNSSNRINTNYNNSSYNRSSGYYSDTPTVINNYYSTNGSSSSTTKSTTKNPPLATATSVNTNPSDSSNDKSELGILDDSNIKNNLLGASAANGLTALSINGSRSFMPSSIWQWVLVGILILIIIILVRVLTNPKKDDIDPHTVAAHH